MPVPSLNRARKSFQLWPVGLIVVMTAFVAVNLAFLTVAFRHKPQLVSDHYYAEGFDLKDIARRNAAGNATGWKLTAHCLPPDQADQPLVEVQVVTAAGVPCDSLTGSASFYRPSNNRLDIPSSSLRFIGGGRYLAVLPRPLERGAWQAVVKIARGSQSLEQRVSLFVER
jgi:nitrogen fixation protein FixH